MAKEAQKRFAARPAVVVEIGLDWLKVLQTGSAKGGLTITKGHVEKFDAIGSPVAQSLAAALKKHKFSNIPVIGCLPRQTVTVKMIELPSTDPDEIADMVELQVGKQTPYSRDEIMSGYRIVGAGREGYTRVMLAIVQRSVLRERFYILEEAGLEIERMSVSSEGMLTWASYAAESGGATAILDVDSSCSDFVVMGPEGLVYTRSVLVGADQLLADPDTWRESLAREAGQSLETCRAETPGLTIGSLILTGAGPRVEGLKETLGDKLDLTIKARDSLQEIAQKPKHLVPDGAARAVSLTSLLGVGLAPDHLEFDLIPDSVRLRKRLENKARGLTRLSMVVMMALFSASLYGTIKLAFREKRLHRLEQRVAELKPVFDRVQEWGDLIRVVGSRKDTRFSAAHVMDAIYPLVPPGILFDTMNLNMREEVLVLEGTAEARPSVLALVKNMEESALFKDVTDDGIDRDPKTKRYKFKVRGRLAREE